MSAYETFDRQNHAAETDLNDVSVAEVTACECGLPRVYCDDYCGIDDCNWLVY